jgi:hypothetical protein
MDFEFNQSTQLSSNGVTPVRTPGDLLITYDIDHGGTVVTIGYREWLASGAWSGYNALGANAEGAFNSGPVEDPIAPDAPRTLSARTFGEAAINLTDSGLFPADRCVNFGRAYLKSRSSDSFQAELKDFVAPIPVSVSNCGKIIVRKDAVPNDPTDFDFKIAPAPNATGGNGELTFKLDDDADSALPSSRTFEDVFPGAYAISEILGALSGSWDLTGVQCTASTGSTWVRDGAKVDVTLLANGHVDCTFTNTRRPAKLNVVKHVINDNGGTAEAADFTMNVSGINVSDESFPGKESPGTQVTLDPGAYEVTEDVVTGYIPGYSADCQGTIAAGQTKTCTVTNNDAPPGLTVIKHVINDDGGTAEAGDFEISVTGVDPDPAAFDGDEEGTNVVLKAGAYEVKETEVAGYKATYSAGCEGTIALGEAKECVITNDDIQPKLNVIKKVVNDNGGTLAPDDFTINVDGDEATPASFPGDADGTEVLLDAGSFAVTEDAVTGYAGTYAGDCSGIIVIGETRTCTITNNDAPPGLTVVKHVINDNGGTAKAGDVTITVTGTAVNPATFPGSEEGTQVALDAGEYKVTETALKGYVGTLSAECSGTIALGEQKVCTITNNDVQPVLIVKKHVINDHAGTKKASDFTLAVTGGTPTSFPGSEEGTEVALNAGDYIVDETSDPEYVKSFAGDCVGTIAVGEQKTCTVINDDVLVEVLPLLLPRTGMGFAGPVLASLGLLLAGAGLLLLNRRRARKAG